MTTPNKESDFRIWLVEKRNDCQQSCLDLLMTLEDRRYAAELKRGKFSLPAQDLVGIAFSLWRAVFLADKESKLGVPLAHSKKFLDKIVRTNAIAFSQEIESNEWSFNYYFTNARNRLQKLTKAAGWEDRPLITKWITKSRTARGRWEYSQKKFDEAVSNFKKELHRSANKSK